MKASWTLGLSTTFGCRRQLGKPTRLCGVWGWKCNGME